MFKVVNKNIGTTSLTTFPWIHRQLWTYSTPYSSVYIVKFEQVNVYLKPVSWQSIYTWLERDHRSTIVNVNFEHMTPCVSTVDFGHVFIFWVWCFNNSIVFRLRWIQISFIYGKDFLRVKYLHEVACISPWLIFFSKFIQNF